MKIKSLSVVIPAYNEAGRLPPTLLDLQKYLQQPGCPPIVEVLVVDDGSKDQTLALVSGMMAQWPLLRLLSLPQNAGKGAALRAGVLASHGEWVLLADADQATPWSQVEVLLTAIGQQGAVGAIASRAHLDSQIRVRQSWLRERMGKTFNLLLRSIVGLPFKDTQCGFKLFLRNQEVQEIFNLLKTRRFAYDVEVLLELQIAKQKIIEVPVIWEHREESRVHIVFDSIEMLFSLIKLRCFVTLRSLKRTFFNLSL